MVEQIPPGFCLNLDTAHSPKGGLAISGPPGKCLSLPTPSVPSHPCPPQPGPCGGTPQDSSQGTPLAGGEPELPHALFPLGVSSSSVLRAGTHLPPALGSGPGCPRNSFPSERKCFVLFLFISYPTACWFLVHLSNIHHLLVCVCV